MNMKTNKYYVFNNQTFYLNEYVSVFTFVKKRNYRYIGHISKITDSAIIIDIDGCKHIININTITEMHHLH